MALELVSGGQSPIEDPVRYRFSIRNDYDIIQSHNRKE